GAVGVEGRGDPDTAGIYLLNVLSEKQNLRKKSMSNGNENGITPNAKRLLCGGFAAILAAGVGAAIRGGILANWGAEFGFTGQQLGDINGAGFTGFCFGIVIGGVVAD